MRRWRNRSAAWLALLGCWLGAGGEARAQTTTFTLDRAQLSGAPEDGFMVYRPVMGEETRFYGNFAFGYAHAPLRKNALTSNGGTLRRIEDPIQGQFVAYPSAGVEILGRVGFNLHLPFVPYQFTGADPAGAGIGQGGLTGTNASLGDLRFDARGAVLESSDGKARFGVSGFFTIPTGSEEAFGGDRGANAAVFASGEYDFGSFFVAGHLGPHFRPSGEIVGSSLEVTDELRYAVGAFLPLRSGDVRLGVELWGSTGFEGRTTTLEWMAQGRLVHGPEKRIFTNFGAGTRLSDGYGSADFRLLASIGAFLLFRDTEPKSAEPRQQIQSRPEHYEPDTDGDGYPDGVDQCPGEPEDKKGPKPSDGCPAPADADSDGIPDAQDECPGEAEDFDGLGDQDGCPEEDLDGDTVADEDDACPEEPGPPNTDASANGCPTRTKVTEDGMISLLEPIEFERGKTAIRRASYPIIDEVATFMKARPEVKVQVHGYTDNVGSYQYNVDLSQGRAAAVRDYLVEQGIDSSRVTSKGHGPDEPIETNQTAEGRARNRRVEFVIIEPEAESFDQSEW